MKVEVIRNQVVKIQFLPQKEYLTKVDVSKLVNLLQHALREIEEFEDKKAIDERQSRLKLF
jgi:hypothetical protein